MRCDELMKTNIECAFLEQSATEAARRMRDQNIGFMPVCDHDRHVLGTLTDRDLALRVIADGNAPNARIGDVMTHEVVSCKPEDDLKVAEERMAKFHKSRIVCVDDDDKLVGVISLSDIAQHGDDQEAAQTLREITSRETWASPAQA